MTERPRTRWEYTERTSGWLWVVLTIDTFCEILEAGRWWWVLILAAAASVFIHAAFDSFRWHRTLKGALDQAWEEIHRDGVR